MSINKYRIVIIDDDAVSNFLCREMIRVLGLEAEVADFTTAMKGLEYIAFDYPRKHGTEPALLLLDLNMPVMTGWDFLKKFGTLPAGLRQLFSIYLLSSSTDPQDKERSDATGLVKGYIFKPVTKEILKTILSP